MKAALLVASVLAGELVCAALACASSVSDQELRHCRISSLLEYGGPPYRLLVLCQTTDQWLKPAMLALHGGVGQVW